MKKIAFLFCVILTCLWAACSNNSSAKDDKPSWTPPTLPVIEGIAEVTDKVSGLGCEFLVVKVGKEDFTVKITKEFAAQIDSTQTGEFVHFKASENETFEFERLDNSENNLQAAVYFQKVN